LRGLLFALNPAPFFMVMVQLLDGISAAIFGVVSVLVVADLTRGTGHFNFTQGLIAAATGIGASLSTVVAGFWSSGRDSMLPFSCWRAPRCSFSHWQCQKQN